MYCIHCGKQAVESAVFCWACGSRLPEGLSREALMSNVVDPVESAGVSGPKLVLPLHHEWGQIEAVTYAPVRVAIMQFPAKLVGQVTSIDSCDAAEVHEHANPDACSAVGTGKDVCEQSAQLRHSDPSAPDTTQVAAAAIGGAQTSAEPVVIQDRGDQIPVRPVLEAEFAVSTTTHLRPIEETVVLTVDEPIRARSRAGAALIDLTVCFVLATVAIVLATRSDLLHVGDLITNMKWYKTVGVFGLVAVVYYFIGDAMCKGHTVGRYALGIVLGQANGDGRIRPIQSISRTMFKLLLLDLGPIVLGRGVYPNGSFFHDIVGNTSMRRRKGPAVPPLEAAFEMGVSPR